MLSGGNLTPFSGATDALHVISSAYQQATLEPETATDNPYAGISQNGLSRRYNRAVEHTAGI